MVKLLLEVEGIDPDTKNFRGETSLCWAAGNGHEAVVKLLLLAGVDPDSKDFDGRTALSLAAGKGSANIVKLLLVVEGVEPHPRTTRE